MPAWKMLHAFFCVNLPLFCKVEKTSIIFFWNWMLHIRSLSTKFLKISKEKSSNSFFERMLYALYTSASIFFSVYIELLWKIYYYRLCQGFIILRFVFYQLIHDTQRQKRARISAIVVWYGRDLQNFRIYICFHNFPVIKFQGCSLGHC